MFGLGFLNSLFLAGLAATVLPILIHILNRRRVRKIRFSSLEFIDELNKRRMSKINLRRWIILLLCTLDLD
ncbi:MAG: BatA domain-containing protein [Candidatus Latescibacterota bacterium]|nr:MAG: BatA domain-containing protein [Candidatus Latescibacterota bacterium]